MKMTTGLLALLAATLLLPVAASGQSVSDIKTLTPEERRAYFESLSEEERQAVREQWRAERKAHREQRRAEWEALSEEGREAKRAEFRERRKHRRDGGPES